MDLLPLILALHKVTNFMLSIFCFLTNNVEDISF